MASEDSDFAVNFELETPQYDSYRYEQGYDPKIPESETFTVDAYDKYIGKQLCMPLRNAITEVKVVGQNRYNSGNLIGVSHPNPLQTTHVYEVAFSDGTMA